MADSGDGTGAGRADFLGRGWGFPPEFDAAAQGVAMTEKEEDIRRSLQILLSTAVGERVMQPRYGCNMEDLLFESLDTTAKSLAKDRIRTAILYFEPRIDLKSVEIGMGDELAGELLIEIEYVVRATNSRYNFVFPFYRNEGTEIGFFTGNAGGP
jgi:phage baseplate assembly protein W